MSYHEKFTFGPTTNLILCTELEYNNYKSNTDFDFMEKQPQYRSAVAYQYQSTKENHK